MKSKRVVVGSDHAGFLQKNRVVEWLKKNGFQVEDVGCFSEESTDYPDYAKLVAGAVAEKKADWGVLLCGSGIGVSIVANKMCGIRAALVFHPHIASLARTHNDANIACFPARFMSDTDIIHSLDRWVAASFEGGRHAKRVAKIETTTTTIC